MAEWARLTWEEKVRSGEWAGGEEAVARAAANKVREMEERQAEAFERLREELMPIWQKHYEEGQKVKDHNKVMLPLLEAIWRAGGVAHAQVPFKEDRVIAKTWPALPDAQYQSEPGGRTYLYEVTQPKDKHGNPYGDWGEHHLSFTQDIRRPMLPEGELLNTELGRKLHDEYVKRYTPPREPLCPWHTGPQIADCADGIRDAYAVVAGWMIREWMK
jgi:hypothetical protein